MYHKELHFKKSDYSANITLELRDLEDHKIEFSAVGTLKHNRSLISGGQCIDSIAKIFSENKTIKRIEEIWKEYHLNTMHPGCIHQRQFESEPYENHKDSHCEICNYTYGHGWMYETIPEEIINEIKSFNGDEK